MTDPEPGFNRPQWRSRPNPDLAPSSCGADATAESKVDAAIPPPWHWAANRIRRPNG